MIVVHPLFIRWPTHRIYQGERFRPRKNDSIIVKVIIRNRIYLSYRQFLTALETAGIEKGGIVWHNTRDTFGTRLLEEGANLYDDGKLGRWSDLSSIIKQYGHSEQSQ
jgi:hypothetical protein